VEPKECETKNDRNDRAIRRAVKWYSEHLQSSRRLEDALPPKVLLLTDDAKNRELALAENLLAASSKI
jgi:exosome complex exonuclease DIS3/RRP44